MGRRSLVRHALAAALAAAWAASLLAVPLGYRYVGSRVVSQGRVVLWYWNPDRLEADSYGVSFVARLYARAPDAGQERPFAAIVRCDSKTYRDADARAPYEAIDDDEPIGAVWRAGCDQGKVLDVARRNARLNGAGHVEAAIAGAKPPSGAPLRAVEAIPTAAKTVEPADPRRADACVKFADIRPTPAGDATISNSCAFPIEVTLCYKGGGGPYACPSPPRGKYGDSLSPGATHVLPEYRRSAHRGITAVACRGTVGSVFPRLDDASGRTGCE